MLSEEVKRYRELSGDNNPNTPISRIGGFLDGYEKAMESKTGYWKRISMDKYVQHAMAYYRCSECGKDIIGEHNYCPYCGAKME